MRAKAEQLIVSLRRLDRRIVVLLWAGALTLCATGYLVRERDALAHIPRILVDADPWWLLGTLSAHLLIIALVVTSYRILLQRLGHAITWWTFARLQVQREVVGTIAPLGGPASLYVYLRGLKRRAVAADDALLAAGMRGATDSVAGLAMLVFVLALHPPPPSVVAGLAVVLGVLVSLIVGAVRWKGLQRCVGRYLPARVHQFLTQARAHAIRPVDLIGPFSLAVLGRITSAAMLYAALRALGEDPSLLLPLVATVVGNLSRRLAPAFQGLGVVEAAVAAALERQGISAAAAIGAALICRLGSLWLPLGLVALTHTTDCLRSTGVSQAVGRRLSFIGRPRALDRLSG